MTHAILVGAALVAVTYFARVQPPAAGNPAVTALVGGNNQFALDLYQHLRKDTGNLFFSPYSISNALAMTYAGARGKTADDMAHTLRFPFTGERLHPAFSVLVQDLNRPDANRKYQLSVAN